MIVIKGIYSQGLPGQFRANADMIGWKGDAGGEPLIHPVGTVKRGEWLEGKLRVLCEDEGEEVVLALSGFKASDFDTMWRHFESHCGVYIKKHRPAASLSEANFDAAMQSLERSADQVDEQKSGSVQKKAKEQDLLKKVEGVRDGLEEAVKGDKTALSRVFAENGCERIGRLRLVLDTVQLEVYKRDDRWVHLRKMARTVECVLREVGSFRLWKPSEGEDTAMMRRQMVWELRKRQGGEGDEGMLDEDWESGQAVEEAPKPRSTAVDALRNRMEAQGFNPLAGLSGPADPLAGGYGGPREAAPAPMPDPAPYEEEEEGSEEEDPGDARPGGGGGEDLSKYEDEEVANPLLTPAAPPGHADDMGLGKSEEARRMHYTRADSVLEGWVWKRSRFLKKWRRRWIVLTKSALESLKQRGAAKATESIEAGSVHRVYSADGEVQMARCFCVVGNKRSFFMVCDDEAQKSEWIRQVSNVLGTRRY